MECWWNWANGGAQTTQNLSPKRRKASWKDCQRRARKNNHSHVRIQCCWHILFSSNDLFQKIYEPKAPERCTWGYYRPNKSKWVDKWGTLCCLAESLHQVSETIQERTMLTYSGWACQPQKSGSYWSCTRQWSSHGHFASTLHSSNAAIGRCLLWTFEECI